MKDILQEAVAAGDFVSFQIADNLKAAKQAEKLGSSISHLVGELQGGCHPFPESLFCMHSSRHVLTFHSKRVQRKFETTSCLLEK